MIASIASYIIPADTPATVGMRAATHAADTAACIALLLFAAALVLDTLPEGVWRNQAAGALILAARVPVGKQEHASKASEGWGQLLRVEVLWRVVAGPAKVD